MNPYHILGVPVNADAIDIKLAYRKKARRSKVNSTKLKPRSQSSQEIFNEYMLNTPTTASVLIVIAK